MNDNLDLKLSALLSASARPPDEQFVAQVEKLATLDLRVRETRRTLHTRLGAEAAAAAAVLAALFLSWGDAAG